MATVHKEGGVKAFADKSALHVDACHQNGVNLASGDGGFQRVKGHISGHGCLIFSGFGLPIGACWDVALSRPAPAELGFTGPAITAGKL
jgi:hypothetical protein